MQPMNPSKYPSWAAASGFIYSLGVFYVPFIERAVWQVWALTAGSVFLFAGLYVGFLRFRETKKKWALASIGLMAILGLGLLPVNIAAVTYVVYASAMVPLILIPRQTLPLFGALAVVTVASLALLAIQNWLVIGGWITFLIFATGSSTLYLGERERQYALLRHAQEEIEGLATIAERERIARDLHDLLGHTLSVIVLKSELASKIAESDPTRALAEIRDVETVSRGALSEVRAAVAGYRTKGFAGELERAGKALAASGVSLDAAVEPITMLARHETVVALALREAITNVVRHAKASSCMVSLRKSPGIVVLTVRDNGIGGVLSGGSGLAGMRERVKSVGGSLDVDGTKGVTITVGIPVEEFAT